MKKLLFLLLFITGTINAQIVDIPDVNFKAKLLDADANNTIAKDLSGNYFKIDANNDGEIQESEALTVSYINVKGEALNISNTNIFSLIGIEAFTNLETLDCSWNNFTNLDVTQNVNLKNLICAFTDEFGDQLTSLDVSSLVNLQTLDCSNHALTSLDITQNIDLQDLDCSYNRLTSLDVTQNTNLQTLMCSSRSSDMITNGLTSLDVSQNVNLQTLNCSINELSNLNLTQNTNLQNLSFDQNFLTSIDLTNNLALQTLVCYTNDLSSLDVSQNLNLQTLNCINNELTSLDVSQNVNLQELRCSNNLLTSLDVTQNLGVQTLDCSNNELTILDVSQNASLQNLFCYSNELTTIDVTQNKGLEGLFCERNQLTTIDVSQNRRLNFLHCNDNQLTTLFIKNGSFESLILESPIPGPNDVNIQYICADKFQVDSVQNLVGTSTQVNSYCSVLPGGNYNTVTGAISFDANTNGCDASGFPYPNIKLNINEDVVFSDAIGDYFFYTGVGSFDIRPDIENPSWFTVSPVTANVTFTAIDNSISTQNFCIVPNGVHQDVDVIIAPIVAAQPGFDAVYNMVYSNKGNQVTSGAIELAYDDTVLDYISSSVDVASQTSGGLLWNYTGLNPFESRSITLTLNVNSPMELPAVNIDDVLVFEATINPVASDEMPVDNVFSLKQVVIGSYDPNDITCLEGDTVSPDNIGDDLHYNINFENTGTAAATFVVIKDVLDEADYDISSIRIMYASHAMQTRVVDNTIEFIFDNINLGPNEKGNVVFKIKTKNSLGVGDSVANDAEIFFDYNFPIETNIATTSFQVLSTDEFEINNTISVFPNPTNEIINIKSNSIMTSIKIYDALGRAIYSKIYEDISTKIDCSNYMDGIYYLKINTEFGQSIKQMIKN